MNVQLYTFTVKTTANVDEYMEQIRKTENDEDYRAATLEQRKLIMTRTVAARTAAEAIEKVHTQFGETLFIIAVAAQCPLVF